MKKSEEVISSMTWEDVVKIAKSLGANDEIISGFITAIDDADKRKELLFDESVKIVEKDLDRDTAVMFVSGIYHGIKYAN